MSSTYSSSLRIELIGSGDQAGAWGATTDSNLGYILDTAVAGYQAVPITSTSQALTYVNGATATANLNQAVYAMLKFTGASAATSVYIPPVSKQYIVYNNSGYAITIYNSTVIGNTTAAGTGITVANGDKILVWSDGTNVLDVKSSGVAGTLPIANGGTGQTTAVAAFNALSTNAVYIDGSSNVGIGTASPAARLDVSTATAATNFKFSGNNFAGGNFYGTSVNTSGVFTGLDSAGGFVINVRDSGYQAFNTTNTERMRIDSSGNVGIGTSSPSTEGTNVRTAIVGTAGQQASSLATSNSNAGFTVRGNSSSGYQLAMGATNNGSIPYIQGVNYNGGSASADLAIQAYGGNVGIGTTSPAGKLDVAGNTYLNGLRISGANTADTVYQATGDIGISAASASTNIKFNINSAERMRIDSSGNVLVGATSGTDFKFKVSRSGNLGIATLTNTDTSGLTYDQTQIIVGQAASSAYMFARYYTSAGTTAQFAFRGDGQMFATSTSISSISDARTKENVRESSDGLNTVLGLRAVRFDFKEGFSNNRKNQLGFIAQEIEEVFPDAVDVSGQKAEDGSEYKTVAPSTLIPVLVKAIQELKALTNTQANTITALTARIEALENK